MPDVQLSIRRCAACGDFLPKGRKTLLYCNSACRASYWRMKRALPRHSVLAQAYIAEFRVLAKDPSTRVLAFDAMDEILNTLGADNVNAWFCSGTAAPSPR